MTTDPVWIVEPFPGQQPSAADVAQVLARCERQLERIAVALERMVDGVDAVDEAADSGTPLPEGFPGREDLHEAGVFYLECVPRTGPGLAVLGLDGRTVNQVLTRLKGYE